MAIIRGLNEDAVLWKYTTVESRPKMEAENRWRYVRDEQNRIVMEDVTIYHLIKLYSRRCRTNGTTVSNHLRPFLEKLKIRLVPQQRYRRGEYITTYRAIGCEDVRVTEEEYNNAELHEVAQRYYDRINNNDLLLLMDKDNQINLAILEELKNFVAELEEVNETEAIELEEDATVPNEPNFFQYDHQIWA